jgi:hypothetical protein
MTAQAVPPVPGNLPFVDGRGYLTKEAFSHLNCARKRSGGQVDKVEAAYKTAAGAVPQGTEVVATGGVQGGGQLGGNVGLTLYVAVTSVANLPTTTALSPGDFAYALDGCKPGESSGSGTGVPVFWSAGGWYSACSGTVVAS